MERIWILIFVAFLAKETEQQRLVVRTNTDSPLQASERDEIELNCIIRTADRPTQFQWLLADNLISNGTEIGNLGDIGNYNLSLIQRRDNLFHYNLRIKQVFRTHHGRWTCRAIENSSTIQRVNIVLMVAYVPDQIYPVCEMAGLSLICETQEGNPRVSLEWYVESVEQQLNVKPSAVRTVDGIIHSEVRYSSLRPPNWMKEYVVCETDFGNCSVSKGDVYNQTELYIFKEEQENRIHVHCNVSNILNEGSLVFEWEDPSLEGKMALHEGHATLSFRDEGFGYKEEVVVCRYLWGIMDNIAISIVVDIPVARPLYSTTELTGDFLSTELVTTKSQPTSDDHFLHSITQISSTSKSVESNSTSTKYIGGTQTVETIHYFSTSKSVTSPEESVKSTLTNQKLPTATKIFATKISVETYDTDPVTYSGTTLSSSKLEKTTLSPNNLITTVLMNLKSTGLMEEIATSSDKPHQEDTTIPRVTYTDDTRRAFTSVKIDERTVTPQATTKGLELSTKPKSSRTMKTAILEAKPTIPLLSPESKVEPADDQGRNISLLLISLIVIFVVLLIAVIVYQKWKEKTGSYSLPSSTSPNVKNPSASTFRPKPEYSY